MSSLPLLMLEDHEVATVLRVTPDAVQNLHRQGKLRGRLVGRVLRWRLVDVEKFVESLEEKD